MPPVKVGSMRVPRTYWYSASAETPNPRRPPLTSNPYARLRSALVVLVLTPFAVYGLLLSSFHQPYAAVLRITRHSVVWKSPRLYVIWAGVCSGRASYGISPIGYQSRRPVTSQPWFALLDVFAGETIFIWVTPC